MDLAREGNPDGALALIARERSRDWWIYKERLQSVARTESIRRPTHDLHFTLENDYVLPLPEWDRSHKTLIIFGDSGLGKTQLAKNLLPHSVLAKTVEMIRKFGSVNDGIIMDDLCIYKLPLEQQIAIVDRYDDTCIPARYSDIQIPRGTPVIFTTGALSGPEFLMKVHDMQVRRRIVVWKLIPSLLEEGKREAIEVEYPYTEPTARAHTYRPRSEDVVRE